MWNYNDIFIAFIFQILNYFYRVCYLRHSYTLFFEYFSNLFKCKMSLPKKLISFSCFINSINSDKETETDINFFCNKCVFCICLLLEHSERSKLY